MEPLPMLRALAAMTTEDAFPTDDESLMRVYDYAKLTMKQKLILAAIYDLFRADADATIVQPWVNLWMEMLDDQEEHCAICDLHVMILKWFSGDYLTHDQVTDCFRTQLAVLDNLFTKAKDDLDDENPSYTEIYELHQHYEDALTLLSAQDELSHLLDDLHCIAPDIYDHLTEHESDLRTDFPEWAWDAMV